MCIRRSIININNNHFLS